MPSGLSSPRSRPPGLPDLGERSAFVGGQRVGRVRRRRHRPLARARRVLGRLLLLLAVPAALGLGVRWLLTTPRFATAGLDARGAPRGAPGQPRAAAAIEAGTSLFRLDTGAAVSRIVAIPEIRRAEIVRELPDRVVISVEERRPFTLVHAGRLHWLDEEGRLLGPAAEAVAPSVPVVSGLS